VMSSLFRNVPGLTSIEVSLFRPSETARFFFLLPQAAGAVEKWESCFWISTFPPPTQSGFLLLRFSPISHWPPELWQMWKSRAVCEISKESWKAGKSCPWISTLSTLRHFHSSVLCFLGALHVYLLVAPPPGMTARRRRRLMSSRRPVFQLWVGRSCGDLFAA